jgi:DNA-binding NarL/FixJ family response regulator
MAKISFAICEKSYLIRKGLASVIEKIPDTKIIQQIENAEELIVSAGNCDADYLILNKSFATNPEIKKVLSTFSETTRFIILVNENDNEITGINYDGIINVNDTQNILLKKIKEITGKNTVIQKDVIPGEISKREADILKNIASGFSNKEIADKLFISTHTVVTHRKNITRKLGIKTVPGLTIYAIINKLIDIDKAE